ncbi:MAG: site-specific recombinase, invertase Pin [Mucilaginibacter sp.]|nr:site-specific recombinase, invertase Pin [Mucilaginibacter sp.]
MENNNKNAIGYLRLSTKDQSKSLEYQESSIRDYCKINNLNVLEIFQGNGEGSYTFDRPDYQALERFIKKQKGRCQYIVEIVINDVEQRQSKERREEETLCVD